MTITHPDVTRYFMTIPEASQLILEAGALGTGGKEKERRQEREKAIGVGACLVYQTACS